jgi:H+/Cl- antiporter ClcA
LEKWLMWHKNELTGGLQYIVPLMLTMMSLWPTFLFLMSLVVIMFELTGLQYIVPLMLTMMSLWPTFLFFSVSGSYNVWVDRRTKVYCTTNVNYDVTVTYFSIFQCLVVIIFELTGGLQYIVPLMLTMMSLWPTFSIFQCIW